MLYKLNLYLNSITFRCEIPDAIEKVFATFAKAFNSEAAASGDQENDKKEVST